MTTSQLQSQSQRSQSQQPSFFAQVQTFSTQPTAGSSLEFGDLANLLAAKDAERHRRLEEHYEPGIVSKEMRKKTGQYVAGKRMNLQDFLKNAKVVWLRFSSEFEPGGALANATPKQIERAWMLKTNNLNESAFGMFRQSAKHNLTMSLAQYNSWKMYKLNRTSEFLHSLSPKMRKFLQKSHVHKTRRDLAIRSTARAEKRAATACEVDTTSPILTITEFDFRVSRPIRSEGYRAMADIIKQLRWHKANSVKGFIPTAENQWGNRQEDKLKLLRTAIEKLIEAKASVPPSTEEEEEDPEVTVQDLEAFDSDGYDSKEDYYK
ncbi:hypothetical protein BT96DRAFT_1000732 [Gymnopus androsaceus JB14]|uniref:Uncharacterized protein n=1 Tax=Gymnopus androsaceus JB14 TaxID=1447944 RepID=A0A6A4H1G5_9AGAR|nr:hypothetical protein BT96DRAFT_1000732 [Gymnopus androsaceus JB14]